ncbi:MAG: hypothetical protein KKB30_15785 [Proteobacteria bacterium]|nr:hypothetical protein [Pseudomonadota bacterium]
MSWFEGDSLACPSCAGVLGTEWTAKILAQIKASRIDLDEEIEFNF